ncbi:MAG: hypothetical protein JWL87_683, partial [Candidatus Adlerbacteria bacterium]|nr:hypothetical protein [Candidatus Adlerbacteria bacterium]
MPQQRFRRMRVISALAALLLSPALIAFAASLIPGTPVSIASVNGVINSIAILDSSHVVVAYQDTTNSNRPKVAICSISGTTPTCDTPVTVAAVTTSALGVTALDSTHIAVAYRDNTNGNVSKVVICSVSGTTPTCDSPVTFAAVVSVNYFASALDSTHVGISYSDANNSGHPTVVICSVSGTTPTCGTPVSVASVNSDHQSAVALDSTHFAVVYRDQSNGQRATVAICSISGITPTCGTTVASSVAGLTPSLARLDDTHFALAYRNFTASPSAPTVQLCSVSGTTPSCGAAAAIAPNSSVYTSIIAIDSTHLAVAYQDLTNSNRPTVVTCFISGSTFSCDPATVLSAVASTYTAATVVDSTHIAVMYQDTTNGSHPTLVVSAYAPISAPTVTTQSASSISRTTARANGNITSDGGATITVRGFTYGTSADLTSGTATTTDSGSYGAGAFTGSLAGLTCNTMYYTRSYATNSA